MYGEAVRRKGPFSPGWIRAAAWRVGLVALVLVAAGAVVPGRAEAATLPAGFAVRTMPSGQAEPLTDFAFAPDGSYLTIGKSGRVAWVSAAGTPRTLATLPVVHEGDTGLTGLAVARDYATSRQIYLARTVTVSGRTVMRFSAWTVAGSPEPTSLTTERVIWDLPTGSDAHAMTGVVAAPD